MKIVNIDASKNACMEVCHCLDFVLDVVGSLKHEVLHLLDHQIYMSYHGLHNVGLPLSPIRKFEEEGYENIFNLLHTIPIYLRNSQSTTLNKEETSNEEEGYVDIIDLLGAYFPNKTKDAPYIELYVDTILNEVNTKGGKFEWLFTKVLIHELAHAALDINNCERYGNVPEKIHYNTPFGKWREESMANAVALRVIRDYGDQSFYDYSEKYMLSQPAKYALGVKMVDFGYWDFLSVIKGKRDGVNKILQDEWLDYVKNGNPTWQGLHGWNDILFDSTI